MTSDFVVKFKALLSNANDDLLCFLITIAGIRALHHGPYPTLSFICGMEEILIQYIAI